jgi:VWFA-related protein
MRNRRLSALLAFSALRIAAQSETPVIKVEVPTVSVDVIVTDKKGHHVPGLSAQDFKILEAGVPQTIASFIPPVADSAGPDQPAQAYPQPVHSPSTAAPHPAAQDGRSPQFITLVIDLGDLQWGNLKNACHAAEQYVEKTLASGNQVSLYWVDTGLHLAVPFSSDKARLMQALDKLAASVPTGRSTISERLRTERQIDDLFTQIHPETFIGIPPQGSSTGLIAKGPEAEMDILRSWLTISQTFQARAVFVALRAIAIAYRDLPGRKSVVVFSEGFLHAPDAGAEMHGVIDAANRAGVAFYVIDVSGGNSGMNAEDKLPDIGGHRKFEAIFADGPGAVELGHDQFDWAMTLPSDVHADLGVIAHSTGGFLVTDTNDLVKAIERVEQDGSEFYTLIYHPSNRNYNGAFRPIKVTLSNTGNNPSYRLRYRQGYFAIPPGRDVMMTPAAAQLLSGLETGSRKPSFSPQVNAAFVPSRDGRYAVPVAVSMPGNLVHFVKEKDKKDQYAAGVTLLLIASDARGQMVTMFERYADLRFTGKQREAFEAKTFNIQGHMPVSALEPLTVHAIVEFTGGAVGRSAPVPLSPPTSASGARLTSLVLSNHVEPAECTEDLTDPLCIKNVRVYMPAHPRFAASDKLTLYFSALGLMTDAQTKKPALRVTFHMNNGKGTSVIVPERKMAVPGKSADSLMVLAEFDLKKFARGDYTVTADVEDTIGHATMTGKADFAVE